MSNMNFCPNCGHDLDQYKQKINLDKDDDLYTMVKAHVTEIKKASTSDLQKKFHIGYGRASQLMDELEDNNVIGPKDGENTKRVLKSKPK